jgi:hypothetical protein
VVYSKLSKQALNLRHRQLVIEMVYSIVQRSRFIPSYKNVVAILNAKGIKTTWGNCWTDKRLFRFLQNAGVSGLWGLKKFDKSPVIE